MVSALICSGQLSLPAWGTPILPVERPKRKDVERRWRDGTEQTECRVGWRAASDGGVKRRWSHHRLYLALDTTVLWNQYCIWHLSRSCVVVVQCITMASRGYGEPLALVSIVTAARWLLRQHPDIDTSGRPSLPIMS